MRSLKGHFVVGVCGAALVLAAAASCSSSSKGGGCGAACSGSGSGGEAAHAGGSGSGSSGDGGVGNGGVGADGGGGTGQAGDGSAGVGEAGTGMSGAGAGGGSTEPLSIVAISPSDGSDEVERDEPVVITFSDDVDEASVDEASVIVQGPNGDIAGSLEIDGAQVTFTPDDPYWLQATIAVELTEAVRGVGGSALAGGFSSEFSVRDGRFGPPVELLGYEGIWSMSGNDRGDVLVVGLVGESAYAVNYDARRGSWSAPVLVETFELRLFRVAGAINDDGEAVVIFSGGGTAPGRGGWNRYTPAGGWGSPRLHDIDEEMSVALTDDGTTVLLHGTFQGPARAQTLAPNATAWSAAQQLSPRAIRPLLQSLGREVLGTYFDIGTSNFFARVFSAALEWGAPNALGAPSRSPSNASLDAHGGRAWATWTESSGTRARLYDGLTWGASMPVNSSSFYSSADFAGEHAVVVWSEGAPETMRERSYSASNGWAQPVTLGPTSESTLRPSVTAVSSDGAALVAWAHEHEVNYRRRLPGQPWSPTRSFPTTASVARALIEFQSADALSGDVMLVWSVDIESLYASRFE